MFLKFLNLTLILVKATKLTAPNLYTLRTHRFFSLLNEAAKTFSLAELSIRRLAFDRLFTSIHKFNPIFCLIKILHNENEQIFLFYLKLNM